MTCQRPGAFPRDTCTRPPGLSGQWDAPPATMPAVPMVNPTGPSSTRPIAVVWMTASPPPPNTGVPSGMFQRRASSAHTVPVCSIDSTTSGSSARSISSSSSDRTGDLKLDELITQRYPLEQVNEGYADLLAGKNVPPLIVHRHD